MKTELQELGLAVTTSTALEVLTPEAELELIALVKDGDSEAFEQLCRGYARGLSGCLRGFRSERGVDIDEARQEILVGFYENIMSYDLQGDTSVRLAYGVKSLRYRLSALRDEQAQPINIPARTLRRYRALHRRYDGDIIEMFAGAAEESLSHKALMFIHSILNSENLDPDLIDQIDQQADSYGPNDNDEDLVQIAFGAIADDQEATQVIWYLFSFDQRDESRKRTDGDVAEIMGTNRNWVQRKKTDALRRMREVLLGGGSSEALLAS